MFDACAELNKQISGITDEAVTFLTKHTWPGNLRELKNVMRRAVLFTDKDVIEQVCLEGLIRGQCADKCPSAFTTLKDALRNLEKKLILETMEKTGGNKTKASEILEISYANLLSKLKEYDFK